MARVLHLGLLVYQKIYLKYTLFLWMMAYCAISSSFPLRVPHFDQLICDVCAQGCFFSLFVGFSPSVVQFLGPVGEDLLLLLCWVPVTSPTVKGLHRSLSV